MEEIRRIFHEHHSRYGTIRITKVLNKKGIHVNRKRVGILLYQMGLYAKGSHYKYKNYNKKNVLHFLILIYSIKYFK